MSSFQHLRSRFHRHNRDSEKSQRAPVYDDQFFDVADADISSMDTKVGSEDSQSLLSFRDDDEKRVYEQQLNVLQEQLVSIMIDNQNLVDELKQYREGPSAEKLKADLESERHRCRKLEKKVQKFERKKKKRRKKHSDSSSSDSEDSKEIVQAEEAYSEEEKAEVTPLPQEVTAEGKQKKGRMDRLWERIMETLYEIVDDFSELPASETQTDEGDPLTVKTLKDNIKRFKSASKPYRDTAKGFYNLVSWWSPAYTFIVFCLYMYCVWNGWLLPLLFLLATLRMFVSYLHHRKFKFPFSYVDAGEDEKKEEKDLGISDKFNLVLLVARKVQNYLGSAADSLEKIKNLLTWRHADGARMVLTRLCCCFVATALLSGSFLGLCVGLGLGVKIFFVNYLYNRFPRLKRKYDATHRLWLALPTDSEHDRRIIKTEMNKYILLPNRIEEKETILQESEGSDSDESSDSSECRELFSLPPSESPLRGWVSGKRTVLIGKERSLVALLAKKRGKLFLTKSFLCFAREKVPSQRNIVIPLQDIVSLQKVKPYSKMPGRGMAIQIRVAHNDKQNVLVFGGIIGRDDVIQSIEDAWAGVRQTRSMSLNLSGRSELSHRRSPDNMSRIQNFTFAACYEDSD